MAEALLDVAFLKQKGEVASLFNAASSQMHTFGIVFASMI